MFTIELDAEDSFFAKDCSNGLGSIERELVAPVELSLLFVLFLLPSVDPEILELCCIKSPEAPVSVWIDISKSACTSNQLISCYASLKQKANHKLKNCKKSVSKQVSIEFTLYCMPSTVFSQLICPRNRLVQLPNSRSTWLLKCLSSLLLLTTLGKKNIWEKMSP